MQVSTRLPSPPALQALQQQGPLALFLDFDGTLVDLAATPGGICVPAGLARSLEQLAERLEGRLALVSGRAIFDLESHTGALAIARAGSHGSDCRNPEGVYIADIPAALPAELLAEIAQFAAETGFALEDKPHGAALHYRANPALEEQGLAFATRKAQDYDLDVKRGKFVIELVGRGANKGSAVRAFMKTDPFAGATPVFVGDDVTDEDGMLAAEELGGYGILVGDREPTAARYRLPDPAAVQAWLRL